MKQQIAIKTAVVIGNTITLECSPADCDKARAVIDEGKPLAAVIGTARLSDPEEFQQIWSVAMSLQCFGPIDLHVLRTCCCFVEVVQSNFAFLITLPDSTYATFLCNLMKKLPCFLTLPMNAAVYFYFASVLQISPYTNTLHKSLVKLCYTKAV